MKFSVLISVYNKNNPYHLEQALNSLICQTLLPDEIVLVKDGLLTKDLGKIIEDFKNKYAHLKVVELEKNMGLGKALSIGLGNCSHKWVARMDSDDICKKTRFEKQISFLRENRDIDVLGTNVDEFQFNIDDIHTRKVVPEYHDAIYNYAKKRCPINHPSVIFNKQSVIESGGYKHINLNEDYYLWVRMLLKRYKFHNLQESLLYFRVDKNMYRRRGGMKYILSDIRLQKRFLDLNFIGWKLFLSNLLIRIFVRLMPNFLRQFIYQYFLRIK